jgi:hypothetical protein
MPDIQAVNGVAGASIQAVNGVGVADIQAVNGLDVPSGASGATVWVVVQDDRNVAYASESDTTSWTEYDSRDSTPPSGTVAFIHLAYGKDAADGNPIYVASYEAGNAEISYSSDPTNDQEWSITNTVVGGGDWPATKWIWALAWGDGFWFAAGKNSSGSESIMTSTNGSAWTEVDLSSDSSLTSAGIYGLTTNGTGTWWFAQQNRIYKATDDGSGNFSWSLRHTLLDSSDADPGDIRGLFFTNNSLVAWVDANPALIFSCAVSDDTDWSDETACNTAHNVNHNTQMFAASGRFIAVDDQRYWAADISGKSITLEHDKVLFGGTHGNANCVASDGTGKWMVGCVDGDVLRSTDDGDNWSIVATNVASEQMESIVGNVYLPL